MDSVPRRRVTVEPAGADPVELSYRVAGDGPPVVLVHGIGIDAADVSWRDVVGPLATDHRVLAPDLPGHGESEAPRTDYTTDYFRRVLAAYLDAVDVPTASLVGISMGGAVSLSHALDTGAPERLVLVDSYGLGRDAYWRGPASALLRTPGLGQSVYGAFARSKPVIRQAVGALTAGAGADGDLVDDVHGAATTPGAVRTMRRWQRSEFGLAGFRTVANGDLAALEVPTLLVHGARDPLVPPKWSRDAHRELPDSQLAVFDDSGHWVPREEPRAFCDLARDFLAPPAGGA
jgi:pimeloyl-ACP methyl ester carboxylesterase